MTESIQGRSKLGLEPGQRRVGVTAAALATSVGAAQLLAPRTVAKLLAVPEDLWYQREIGAFTLGLGYGVYRVLRGESETAFVRAASVIVPLLSFTRIAAVATGARPGLRNVVVAAIDSVLSFNAIKIVRSGLG